MKWTGIECISLEKCFPGLMPAEKEDFVRYWSNTNHWGAITIPGRVRRRMEASIKEEYL